MFMGGGLNKSAEVGVCEAWGRSAQENGIQLTSSQWSKVHGSDLEQNCLSCADP